MWAFAPASFAPSGTAEFSCDKLKKVKQTEKVTHGGKSEKKQVGSGSKNNRKRVSIAGQCRNQGATLASQSQSGSGNCHITTTILGRARLSWGSSRSPSSTRWARKAPNSPSSPLTRAVKRVRKKRRKSEENISEPHVSNTASSVREPGADRRSASHRSMDNFPTSQTIIATASETSANSWLAWSTRSSSCMMTLACTLRHSSASSRSANNARVNVRLHSTISAGSVFRVSGSRPSRTAARPLELPSTRNPPREMMRARITCDAQASWTSAGLEERVGGGDKGTPMRKKRRTAVAATPADCSVFPCLSTFSCFVSHFQYVCQLFVILVSTVFQRVSSSFSRVLLSVSSLFLFFVFQTLPFCRCTFVSVLSCFLSFSLWSTVFQRTSSSIHVCSHVFLSVFSGCFHSVGVVQFCVPFPVYLS